MICKLLFWVRFATLTNTCQLELSHMSSQLDSQKQTNSHLESKVRPYTVRQMIESSKHSRSQLVCYTSAIQMLHVPRVVI